MNLTKRLILMVQLLTKIIGTEICELVINKWVLQWYKPYWSNHVLLPLAYFLNHHKIPLKNQVPVKS